MLWWIVGIVAVWVVLGAVAGVRIGRAISHAKVEEAAAELRRAEKHETSVISIDPACPSTRPLSQCERARQ
jgi:hypothetical protein